MGTMNICLFLIVVPFSVSSLPAHIQHIIKYSFPSRLWPSVDKQMQVVRMHYNNICSSLQQHPQTQYEVCDSLIHSEAERDIIVNTLDQLFTDYENQNVLLMSIVGEYLTDEIMESILFPEIAKNRNELRILDDCLSSALMSLSVEDSLFSFIKAETCNQDYEASLLRFINRRINTTTSFYEVYGDFFDLQNTSRLMFSELTTKYLRFARLGVDKSLMAFKYKLQRKDAIGNVVDCSSKALTRPITFNQLSIEAISICNSEDSLKDYITRQHRYQLESRQFKRKPEYITYHQTRNSPGLDYLQSHSHGALPPFFFTLPERHQFPFTFITMLGITSVYLLQCNFYRLNGETDRLLQSLFIVKRHLTKSLPCNTLKSSLFIQSFMSTVHNVIKTNTLSHQYRFIVHIRMEHHSDIGNRKHSYIM